MFYNVLLLAVKSVFCINPFLPPENIRKTLVFRCFQGDQKGTLGGKGLS